MANPRSGDGPLTETLSYSDRTLRAEPSVTAPRRSLPGGVRSTVLPRLEQVEGAPRVVLSERPRYEELQALGSGGQAEVILARDHDIERQVAVKRLRSTEDHGAVLRFAEEVRIIGQLEHPNVVPIHDVGVDHNGDYFFVMKHVEGETLESIIAKLRAGDPAYVARYTPELRMQLCYEVLRGVEHAHSLGFLHRDLKPANLMVGPLGEVMVMDWGLAKNVAGGSREKDRSAAPGAEPGAPAGDPSRGRLFETHTGALLGTPAYMAPEQAAGRLDAMDARSDVYSLSVVFYELFTLLHPRRQATTLAEMLSAVVSEPVAQRQVLGDFIAAGAPAALAYFVEKGLAHDPAGRYPSLTAMRERLEAIRDGKAPVQCQITFVQRGLRELSHGIDHHPQATTAVLALIALGLVSSAGFLLWALAHRLIA